MSADWNELVRVAGAEVRATLAALPQELRAKAGALPVVFDRRPNPALLHDGIEPDTLGVFLGAPFAEAEHAGGELPAQIILFLENLWEMVEGDDEFYREEIRTTLLHELGHYLGLDEGDLEERGLE
jgi:predicted Zn-dependent protease with MMP-like domain